MAFVLAVLFWLAVFIVSIAALVFVVNAMLYLFFVFYLWNKPVPPNLEEDSHGSRKTKN